MLDLSIIKNKKLRDLVMASAKFKGLSEFQQQKHLDGMKNLSPAQEEKLCTFFMAENSKENAPLNSEEKLEVLNNLYNELVKLETNFTKLLKHEPENKQREDDENNMNNLMASLNTK